MEDRGEGKRKEPEGNEEGTSEKENKKARVQLDLEDSSQLDFVVKMILNGENSEYRIECALEAAGVTVEEAYSMAMAKAVSDPEMSTELRSSTIRRYLAALDGFRGRQESYRMEGIRKELQKDTFLADFYFRLNLDEHHRTGVDNKGRTYGLSLGKQDPEFLLNKGLDSYKYMCKRTEGHVYRLESIHGVKCGVCDKKYAKYHDKGTVKVCVPCVDRYAEYKNEEAVEKIREAYEGDMRDFMHQVRMYFDNPVPGQEGEKSGGQG